jgi:hypothetical protein
MERAQVLVHFMMLVESGIIIGALILEPSHRWKRHHAVINDRKD